MTNLKLRQKNVNQIVNPHAFFFFLLTGATRYFHAIFIVFTYFASFTGYQMDIFKGISNLHVQGSKFGQKSYFKLNSAEFIEFVFPSLRF